jgi:Ca-activated chloride channel homolog
VKFTYTQPGDGEGSFLSPDDLFPSPALMNFLLQYGQDGLDALPEQGDEGVQELIEEMIQAGLLERDEGGNLKLTPKMVQGMQHRAMLEIFRDLRPGVRDGHASPASGRTGERTDGTKAYEFGDPLGEVAVFETVRNALARGPAPGGGVDLRESDFEVHNVEAVADCATVVLLDLSGSMMRYGRHVSAKRVALGLRAMIRAKFPLDTVDYVGFSSVAEPISEAELPLIMPKPITTHEWQVRVRVPLDQVLKGEVRTHPHFTNLQHGLQMARSILSRRGASNKQVFVITDGQPTAHLSAGKEGVGQTLNLIYPPDPASTNATLAEALRCQQLGIRLSTFALIEEYHGMDWVGFVEQLTRLTRGVAYYCTTGDLAATIMESYLTGKKRRHALG